MLNDISNLVANNIKQLQEQIDEKLIQAIDGVLGSKDWAIEDLARDGRIHKTNESMTESYYLDGEVIYIIYPAEYKQDGMDMSACRRYWIKEAIK